MGHRHGFSTIIVRLLLIPLCTLLILLIYYYACWCVSCCISVHYCGRYPCRYRGRGQYRGRCRAWSLLSSGVAARAGDAPGPPRGITVAGMTTAGTAGVEAAGAGALVAAAATMGEKSRNNASDAQYVHYFVACACLPTCLPTCLPVCLSACGPTDMFVFFIRVCPTFEIISYFSLFLFIFFSFHAPSLKGFSLPLFFLNFC